MNRNVNSAADAKSKSAAARKKRRGNFIERTLAGLVRNAEQALFAEEIARKDGLLQRLDPRVKIVGLLSLILSVTFARNFFTIIFVFAVAVILAVLSRVPLLSLVLRTWLGVLAFTGTIALPVIFIQPGDAVYRLPLLNWTITAHGLTSAFYLISRSETTVTLSLLLVLCTLWTDVLKALRVLRVPTVFVVILGMTYRYIFVMLETARNMFEARQSRIVGTLRANESRRLAAASIGVLLSKSFYLNSEIYLAMRSRGFRGAVYTLDEFSMRRRDWLALVIFLSISLIAFRLGRYDSLAALLNF